MNIILAGLVTLTIGGILAGIGAVVGLIFGSAEAGAKAMITAWFLVGSIKSAAFICIASDFFTITNIVEAIVVNILTGPISLDD